MRHSISWILVATTLLVLFLLPTNPAFGDDYIVSVEYGRWGIITKWTGDKLSPSYDDRYNAQPLYGLNIYFSKITDQTPLISPFLTFRINRNNTWFIGSGFSLSGIIDNWIGFRLTLSLGYIFHNKVDPLYLGSDFLFRESLEVFFPLFNDTIRFVTGLDHLSNAGLGKTNPGVESFFIGLQVPIRMEH